VRTSAREAVERWLTSLAAFLRRPTDSCCKQVGCERNKTLWQEEQTSVKRLKGLGEGDDVGQHNAMLQLPAVHHSLLEIFIPGQ